MKMQSNNIESLFQEKQLIILDKLTTVVLEVLYLFCATISQPPHKRLVQNNNKQLSDIHSTTV